MLGIFAVLLSGAAQADPLRIVALGDSLTAGYGLPRDEGFVPQMQEWLDAQGAEIELINAGVSGDTTAGGLSRVEWTLSDDVDAMIVALGGNDYLRGLPPEMSRRNLAGILDAAAAADVEVMLVGLTVGGNYGADYKTAFDRMFSDLAVEYGVLEGPNWFEGLLATAGTQDRVSAYMQPDGIHPNADGVAATVETLGPAILELAQRVE